MKSVNLLKKTFPCALICFCIILGSTSTFGQNDAQPSKQEIEKLRSLTRKIAEILPNESAVNGSNAFTPTEKTNFQFIKKTIATGTQIPDNPTKASVLNYKSQLAKALDLLLSPLQANPNPNPNSNPNAKANNSSAMGKSIFNKLFWNNSTDPCKDGCIAAFELEKANCDLNNQSKADRDECKIRRGTDCLACMEKCNPKPKN